ncbi:hypothetical protein A3759_06035 [Thalassolituus sp. HI0120]|nr:hypothetical protein A3759_20890 [Thalassolituus sp. HI0120]KZZ46901.1 hypothetical protein A3759_06035 [Thalassolituus sp. HI0120]
MSFVFPIIHETNDWLAIAKPQGIGMHTEGDQKGLVVLVTEQLGTELWPVHRLDKVTSGILLLAKNKTAAAYLSTLFSEHKIQKYYLALSPDKPKKKQGWIKGDMAKSRNGSWKILRSQENPAVTRFISHYDQASGSRLYLLKPTTGKTHQLRVALRSLGAPIMGDPRYGGKAADRTYLHAFALSFEDKGKRLMLTCATQSGRWPDLPDTWAEPERCF